MTNEEAKKLIEADLYCRNEKWVVCFAEKRECIECKGYVQGSLVEAYEVAVVALKKQIPKKPRVEEDSHFDKGECYYCPSCGEPLYTNGDDTYYNYWLEYCDVCGQAIDYVGILYDDESLGENEDEENF